MDPRRHAALTLLLALVVLLAAACGGTAGSSPTTAASSAAPTETLAPSEPADTEPPASPSPAAVDLPENGRIELADKGFAVTIPDNWLTVDLTDEGIQAALDEGLDQMPGSGAFSDQVMNAV